jgi:hypothetical protein
MTELDPFRAVIGAITSSDSLITVANSAGLAFGMVLIEEEGYSHGTRLRVLIPRLLAVFARYVGHPELSGKNVVATPPFGPEETPDEAAS